MLKAFGTLALFTALSLSGEASVIGFDRPAIGTNVTGTVFDNGWHSLLNADNNIGAAVRWYGSPPTGTNADFEPDPGAIPGYKGGAVWLDSAALPNGMPIIANLGLRIFKEVDGLSGDQTLSFFMATEVTSRGQPKGNPAGMFVSINGAQIDGPGPEGTFFSRGPLHQSSPGSWFQYSIPFEATGHDVFSFRDDEDGIGNNNLVLETNAVVADVQVVPETSEMLAIAAIAAFVGFAAYRGRVKFSPNRPAQV